MYHIFFCVNYVKLRIYNYATLIISGLSWWSAGYAVWKIPWPFVAGVSHSVQKCQWAEIFGMSSTEDLVVYIHCNLTLCICVHVHAFLCIRALARVNIYLCWKTLKCVHTWTSDCQRSVRAFEASGFPLCQRFNFLILLYNE